MTTSGGAPDQLEAAPTVPASPTHLEVVGALERAAQPLADQLVVVDEHDGRGIISTLRSPPGRGLAATDDASVPPSSRFRR